ncbi:MAG: OmpA family protein [Paracoccaceae bacterium]|nr:OmpA family protein [Paracoccaceae bacterium]
MKVFSRLFRTALHWAAIVASLLLLNAQAYAGHKASHSEKYIPGIWVDPDGCEHWVMDDGWEGYMTPNVTPDGVPVCHRVKACRVENADQLFAVDKSYINAANRKRLADFFRNAGATAYVIYGHTDSTASDEYNMGLSLRRAEAVAQIARSVGARVSKVRGFGERQPIASNKTAYGRSRNRRVEIICIK